MHQLKIANLDLPRIYIVQGKDEIDKVRELGIPYIVKPLRWSDEKLIKAILFHTLMRKFPHIKWREILGVNTRTTEFIEVTRMVEPKYRCTSGNDPFDLPPDSGMEMSEDGEYRPSDGGFDGDNPDLNEPEFESLTIDEFMGDPLFAVNIEQLQALKMLPVFLDDIAQAIRVNLHNQQWVDGWNRRKRDLNGYYHKCSQAPNLIIVDVSGSIPSGVAATMVTLIETMREQAQADVIITGNRSWWYAHDDELPNPDRLRATIGGCNECRQFYKILREHILGKHWGNVIVFGDQDAPNADRFSSHSDTWLKPEDLVNTRVDNMLAFHTYANKVPGYGLWVQDACKHVKVTIDKEWCQCMKRSHW